MKSSQEESEPQPARNGPDWIVIGIGVMTVAAAIAVATALGASNVAREVAEESGSGDSMLIAYATIGPAVVSLGAFFVVVVTSLSTLFRISPSDREREIKRSAVGLYIQVFAAIIFALLAIIGPLFAVGQQDANSGSNGQNCTGHHRSVPRDTWDPIRHRECQRPLRQQ